MTDVSVAFQCDDQVAVITLGTVDEGIGSDAGLDSLHDILSGLQRRVPAVRAVVMTGASPESFCEEQRAVNNSDSTVSVAASARRIATVFSVIRRFPGVTITAMPGPISGLGLELALNGDFRMATPALSVTMSPARQGRVPLGGGSQLLPRLAGESAAKRLMLLGETFDATQALECGIVDAVMEAETLLPTALQWAEQSLSMEPLALNASKQLIEHARTRPLETGFAVERDWLTELVGPHRD